MSNDAKATNKRIDQFFSGPGGRADAWRDLVEAAKIWARGGDRAKYDAVFSDLALTEEFHGYPGLHLMAALKEAAAGGDAATSLALSTRIAQALTAKSFRQHAGDWSSQDEENGDIPDLLPPTFGSRGAHRPYFETLIVTGVSSNHWPALATQWRRLRRPVDAFVYEPVIVGSLEDAFCAAILNPDLAAVVINEGFALHSRHNAPVLRTFTNAIGPHEESDVSALRLAHILKRVRPELDLYLMSNHDVEELAGNPEANVVRRIFYSVEELLELHLAILEGVQDR
jgi:arginine decarboxylase